MSEQAPDAPALHHPGCDCAEYRGRLQDPPSPAGVVDVRISLADWQAIAATAAIEWGADGPGEFAEMVPHTVTAVP